MKYVIIGSGNIGTALARAFSWKKMKAVFANSRGSGSLAPLTQELGPSVTVRSAQDAAPAETVFLAVPFSAHRSVAGLLPHWQGRIIVDATNALRAAPQELGGRLSSEVVAQAFVGARLVKTFNYLPAAQLGTNPTVKGQRQAVFISGDDADASTKVADVATQLGFAPVELGGLVRDGVPCAW